MYLMANLRASFPFVCMTFVNQSVTHLNLTSETCKILSNARLIIWGLEKICIQDNCTDSTGPRYRGYEGVKFTWSTWRGGLQ